MFVGLLDRSVKTDSASLTRLEIRPDRLSLAYPAGFPFSRWDAASAGCDCEDGRTPSIAGWIYRRCGGCTYFADAFAVDGVARRL